MKVAELDLLDRFQRDFPLSPRPYARIAGQIGMSEAEAIIALRRLARRGCVSRVGVTLAPGRVGAATLAALRVPQARLEAVARLVSAYREVNHNYERDHEFNLWFVVTAPDRARVSAVVRGIERRAGCGAALDLPMLEAYRVDLGFSLRTTAARQREESDCVSRPEPYPLTLEQKALLAALQDGLPLEARPYAELGRRCGMSEGEALEALARLIRDRVIARFGVIVRHRPLGYRANAMAVWDVPDADADRVGSELARAPAVTLCYRRQRHPPHWPYNLYCMLHGTDRDAVTPRIDDLTRAAGLGSRPHAVLFSRRCFKQRGGRYLP